EHLTCLALMSSDLFFFSSRRRHTRFSRDWSSDVCSSDLKVETIRQLPTALRLGYPIVFRTFAQRAILLPFVFAPHASLQNNRKRSEERRVGKECRCRWSPEHLKKKSGTAAGRDKKEKTDT